jgi:hypothetical protein
MEAQKESLGRRVRAMHALWMTAIEDLDLERVNHHERAGVLPIAFSLLHFVQGEDATICRHVLTQAATIWEGGDYARRVGGNLAAVPRGTPLAEAEQLRFADWDAWRAYQTAVFATSEAALRDLPTARLGEPLFDGQMPTHLRGSFVELVVGPPGPVRLIDALECFVFQHGIRHLGEIEHARSLLGLGGVS